MQAWALSLTAVIDGLHQQPLAPGELPSSWSYWILLRLNFILKRKKKVFLREIYMLVHSNKECHRGLEDDNLVSFRVGEIITFSIFPLELTGAETHLYTKMTSACLSG